MQDIKGKCSQTNVWNKVVWARGKGHGEVMWVRKKGPGEVTWVKG